MEKILKMGDKGRLYVSREIRKALNLQKGCFLSVDISEVKFEKVKSGGEDSNEKKK
jgi:bifunctional DNA-binding transcriptional regulator/antitoxin component of YhaV-PrlF toxin-antitoxin module